MQVTAEQTNPCTIVLDIVVDEDQVSRAFDSVYREFSRYANVPGFRPGKAPRAIVERFVDGAKVRERALEKIVTDSYRKVVEEQGITPYRNPEIDPTDLEDKKPYSYKATVPLEPQVTLGEYTSLTVEKPVFAISDTLVEERLQRIREDRARLERVADRGVEPGDVLIAENQVIMEGEEDPAPPRRQLVQLGNNIPGFDEAVMGMMPGEERVFDLTYPEDFDEEARRGKKATYTVKLSSISARKLPEMDEEFAQQVGGVNTMEEVREALRNRLEAEAVRVGNEIAEQRIIDQIVQGSEIYFPVVLIREEVEDKLRQLAQQLQQNKVTYAQYLAQSGVDAETHQNQLAAQAEAQIRALLALRQIAILENLQATDEAIAAEFDRLLSENVITEEQYAEYAADPRRRLQIANALIQQKLHDFLFANNTINEVEQQTTPEEFEAAEEAEAEAAESEAEAAETTEPEA